MSSKSTLVVCAFCLIAFLASDVFSQNQELTNFPANPGGNPPLVQPGDPGNLSLVISQTDEVHEQIAFLLEQLRRLQGMQVVVATPFTRIQDNFFERVGVDFNFNIPGGANIVGLDPTGNPTPDGSLQFRQNSFGVALPQFGGHDPTADATTGFRVLNGGGSLDFNFAVGQGNDRSIVTQVPYVQMMDGQTASVVDVSQTPFVTSVIPVVGGMSLPSLSLHQTATSPVQLALARYREEQKRHKTAPSDRPQDQATRRLANPIIPPEHKVVLKLAAAKGSTAGFGDLSVAEIRRRKKAQDNAKEQAEQQEILALIERAKGAQERGKPGVAKIYYQQAARRASGQLKQDLLDLIDALSDE